MTNKFESIKNNLLAKVNKINSYRSLSGSTTLPKSDVSVRQSVASKILAAKNTRQASNAVYANTPAASQRAEPTAKRVEAPIHYNKPEVNHAPIASLNNASNNLNRDVLVKSPDNSFVAEKLKLEREIDDLNNKISAIKFTESQVINNADSAIGMNRLSSLASRVVGNLQQNSVVLDRQTKVYEESDENNDLQYHQLNHLKKDLAVLEERVKSNTNDRDIEVDMERFNNNPKAENNADIQELKTNFSLLLDKVNTLVMASNSKPNNTQNSSLENTMLMNNMLSNQNKPFDSTKDFLAMQNYFTSLSNKLDLGMYTQNIVKNSGNGNSNGNGNENSSIIKELINYKLLKNLTLDDDREKDNSRVVSNNGMLGNINTRIDDLSELLVKSIKNNLGLAKSTDIDKVNENLGNIMGLQENSLAVKSGMIDILNKLNENTSNLEVKLDSVKNDLDGLKFNLNVATSNANLEELENNMFAINNKLDYLLTSLSVPSGFDVENPYKESVASAQIRRNDNFSVPQHRESVASVQIRRNDNFNVPQHNQVIRDSEENIDNSLNVDFNSINDKIFKLEERLHQLNKINSSWVNFDTATNLDVDSFSSSDHHTNEKQQQQQPLSRNISEHINLNSPKNTNVRGSNMSKPIDVLANMEYLQDAINKAVNNTKK